MADTRTVSVACDGGEMPMRVWLPEAGSGPGVLLIHEIFGVGPYIEAVAERLAEIGYVVAAPEVFWRFAPGWSAHHDRAGLDASLAVAGQSNAVVAGADCVAALGALDELPEVNGTPGVLGFCMGGNLAWTVAVAADPAVCVSYYGSDVPSMLDQIAAVTCPTLLHFGNDDAYIPAAGINAVNAAIAGRPGFVLNVENAGHAFDNHEAAMFWDEPAAQAAWAKTVEFLAVHLSG